MHNPARIWVSVPAITFNHKSRIEQMKRDMKEVAHRLASYGFESVNGDYFDSRHSNWSEEYAKLRDKADAIFIYIDRSRSGSIGKGAFECIRKYKGKKPIYFLYRRKTDNKVCYYRPVIKSFDHARSWNDYADISYNGRITSKRMCEEIAEVVNNADSGYTSQFAPDPEVPANCHEYRQLYHSILK